MRLRDGAKPVPTGLSSAAMRDPIHEGVDRLARRFAYEVRAQRQPESPRDQYEAIATLTDRYGYDTLAAAELRVFSQNGEDGVIAEIFHRIGTTNRFFVEFGIDTGLECNTRFLADVLGWSGVYFEPDPRGFEMVNARLAPRDDLVVVNSAVTPTNADELFAAAAVPDEADLMSIDVDGQDYWIWEAMTSSPRVVIIEFNAALEDRKVEPLGTPYSGPGPDYVGASIGAMRELGEAKGYQLVHVEMAGVNAFFVRDDLAEPFPPALERGANYFLQGKRHTPEAGTYAEV